MLVVARGLGWPSPAPVSIDKICWTNPLPRESRNIDYSLPISQDPQDLDRASVASYNIRGRARGSDYADQLHWRLLTLTNQSTQPLVAFGLQRCVQLFDTLSSFKQTMPIYSKSMPYPGWLCLRHRRSHAPTVPHFRRSVHLRTWIRELQGTSRGASRGDGPN